MARAKVRVVKTRVKIRKNGKTKPSDVKNGICPVCGGKMKHG